MQLLSALSSTTSPLAMQAMPLVGSPTGDFAALIAGMVPAGDAVAVPGERQAAAPTGNPLPVMPAAPVQPVDAVQAVAPPLPVSATEAVLMLPQEADAPIVAQVRQVAPVLAATAVVGALSGVLPEEDPAAAPPRTEDVATRATLQLPVPVRFAPLPPRVKRAEAAPSNDAPPPGENEDGDAAMATEGDATPPPVVVAPAVVPQPAEAILVAAPPTPPAVPDDGAKPAAALVIEDGKVVAAAPAPAGTPPMRLAKRAEAPARMPDAPPARAAAPATPLATDTIVPAHIVVPQQADDIAPDQHQAAPRVAQMTAAQAAMPYVMQAMSTVAPGATSATSSVPTATPAIAPDTPSATPTRSGTGPTVAPNTIPAKPMVTPIAASTVAPTATSNKPVATPTMSTAAPMVTPDATLAKPVGSTVVPDTPSIRSSAMPAMTTFTPAAVPAQPEPSAIPSVMPAATTLSEASPLSIPVTLDSLAPVANAAPEIADAVPVDVSTTIPQALRAQGRHEAMPYAASPVTEPVVLPTDAAVPAPVMADGVVRARPAVRAAATTAAPIASDSAPSVEIPAGPVMAALAPTARPDAPVAERAPIADEAATPVMPVAASTAQPVAVAPPVTRIATAAVADQAPPAPETDGIAPTVRHEGHAAAPMPQGTRVAAAPVQTPAPMVDASLTDRDAPAPRARRDDDLSVPTIGAPQAAGAATLRPVAPTAHAANPTLDIRQPQWVEGMIDRITTLREASGTNSGETRIRLSPDALGDVEVAIRTGDDGKLHVHFNSENADAGRLLAEAQPRLVQMAEARGLKLGGMQVDVGTQPQSGQSQRQAQDQGNPAPRAPRSAARQADNQTTRSDDRIA